jgi:hypothetical protein
MLDFAEAKFHIVEAGVLTIGLRVLPRQGEHLGGHIDANGTPRLPDLRPGQKQIKPAATAEVEDDLTEF